MEIKPQDNIRMLLRDTKIPKIAKVRQHFVTDTIEDVEQAIKLKLREQDLAQRIKPGMRVVLTGSSREIANMNIIMREIAAFVKECGGTPFIVPAMGSHGGSIAENQRKILEGYGITEEFCGCAIYSSMDTVVTGYTPEGFPVHIDRFAAEADAIIPVNRIKAHTAFRGPYESGLYKMLGVGLGKQKGADGLHNEGYGVFSTRIPEYAEVVMKNNNVILGVGIIENALDQTCRIEVIKGENIGREEPALLEYAKKCMPRILFPETDVLIVREIGKNISGVGMDPNVTGTWATTYGSGGIKKQRTVVLDLTGKSHGNALGIGKADTTTMRLFHKIDFTALYPNVLTSTVLETSKIPMVLESDEMAIKAAIKTCTGIDRGKARIVMIRNTLCLNEIMISEAMMEEASGMPEIEVLEEPRALHFDRDGNLSEGL
jgi:hypothetical protein